MEGSKGGTRGTGKSYTGKQSIRQRYNSYCKHRQDNGLPVIGGEQLFRRCWKEEKGIVETRITGQGICDECIDIGVQKEMYEKRADAVGRAEFAAVLERERIHTAEHRGERDYADDFWAKAEHAPSKVTMANMDAPTQDQLEIPVQPRKYRDKAKALEGTTGWASKMMGVMIARLGMLCYLAHTRLGSGPNLTCTCMYLALIYAGVLHTSAACWLAHL